MIDWLESLRPVASLFYPASCTVCSCATAEGEFLCSSCDGKLQRIKPPFCAKCSEPFPATFDQEFVCANCGHRPLYFEAAVSAYRSRGVARAILLQFKYHRAFHLRHLLRGWLLAAMEDRRLRDQRFDFIVPVPLHPAKKRERGFNQAEMLANVLGRELKLPVQLALQRTRYTTTQTALDRMDRIENLRGAFRLRHGSAVQKSRVLLLDDVLTTGSTLSECARVLREGGAASIFAVTAARA